MMGIRPNRDGLIPPVTPDNPETRYSDWLTDLEDSGEIVGGVWKETDAKATSANNAVSDLAGRVGNLENGPVKPHTHTADDITGKTGWVDSTFGITGRIPVTGTNGFLYSRDNPTSDNHLARKGYIDQEVNNVRQGIDDGTQKNHKHTSSDITDATFNVGGESNASKVLRTGITGQLAIQTDSIVQAQHVANKRYVDDENAKLRALLKHAVIAVPPANLADLPSGQVYLDTATLTIHTK